MKILLLTPTLPWPYETRGSAQRTSLLMDALAQFGRVDVAYVARTDQEHRNAEEARNKGLDLVAVFQSQVGRASRQRSGRKLPQAFERMAGLIRDYTATYDADRPLQLWLQDAVATQGYDCVVSRYLWPGMAAGLVELDSAVKLLDWDDIDYSKFRTSVRVSPWPGAGGWLGARLVYRRMRAICRAAAQKFDHVWLTNPVDEREAGCRSMSVLPNIPYAPGSIEAADPSPAAAGLLFVGDLTYQPNIDGFDRFVRRIWPIIRAQVPQATLRAVGIPPPAAEAEAWLQSGGIEIRGVVPELPSFYQGAALSICPIEWGGGTNIKAIESLSYATPVVMFPHTYAGYRQHFDASSGMLVAQTDTAFAEACVKLIQDRAWRRSVGESGRAIAAAHYSVESFRASVRNGVEAALAARGRLAIR